MKTINVAFILNHNLAISVEQGSKISQYVQQFYPENECVNIDLSQLNATTTQFLKAVFEPLNQKRLEYQVITNQHQKHLKAKIKLIQDLNRKSNSLSNLEQNLQIFN